MEEGADGRFVAVSAGEYALVAVRGLPDDAMQELVV